MARLGQESSLAWLDLSEESRQEMQEHLALLSEPGTLDELGIGQVRDVFSNLFFPGTSTLWARARYLLFVPWAYRHLEREGTHRKSGREASRALQAKLIRALKQGGDQDGLIGRRVLEPVSMPDELIWNGLGSWGIRVHEGSLSKYQRTLEGTGGLFEVLRGDSGESLDASSRSWWNDRLPKAPSGYLESSTFKLTSKEAGFLFDQLQELHPDSLLARAVDDDPVQTMDAESVWDCGTLVERLSKPMQEAVEQARIFAFSIQGAGIAYSYLVSAKKGGRGCELAQKLSADLERWAETCTANGADQGISEWGNRRGSFWDRVHAHRTGLRSGTQEFVDAWMKAARQPAAKIITDQHVEKLLRDREWSVKRNLARLSNAKALDAAKAEAGTGLLPFRWFQARRICDDLRIGLGGQA